MQKPTANSFFCGAGGFDCGLIQAGFRIVGAWDFDKYAIQSYKHNIGDHVKQADISQMTAQDVPRADVWTFGFPCQDLSVAGKRAGLFEGKRSGLFFEVMRLLDETLISDKPRILVAENVKGLKPYLPVLAEEYAKRGYTMHVKLFNSKYWGVPQNRSRYFVVGVREGIAGFEFPEECKTNIPKLSSILDPIVDEKYFMGEKWLAWWAKNSEFQLRKKYCSLDSDLAVCLTARQYASWNGNFVTDNGRIRRLTETELGRLQGFPEKWGHVVSTRQSDKQFGNAATTFVAQSVAESIAKVLKPKRQW